MLVGYMVTTEGRHGVRLTPMRFFTDIEKAKEYAKQGLGGWVVAYEMHDDKAPVKVHWK